MPVYLWKLEYAGTVLRALEFVIFIDTAHTSNIDTTADIRDHIHFSTSEEIINTLAFHSSVRL